MDDTDTWGRERKTGIQAKVLFIIICVYLIVIVIHDSTQTQGLKSWRGGGTMPPSHFLNFIIIQWDKFIFIPKIYLLLDLVPPPLSIFKIGHQNLFFVSKLDNPLPYFNVHFIS